MTTPSPNTNSSPRKKRGLLGWILPLTIIFILAVVAMQFGPSRTKTLADSSSPLWTPLAWSDEKMSPANLSLDNSAASCDEVGYTLPADYKVIEFEFEEAAFVTPPNFDGPTLVDLGLFVQEIPEINTLDNTFRLEGFVDLIWCDPRLTFDPEEMGTEEEIFLEEDAAMKLSRIWWPELTFPNQVGSRDVENQELLIRSDGTVDYSERFNITLAVDYDLSQFPFDNQQLFIEIESFAWDKDDLVFHQQADKIDFSTDYEIPEWHTTGIETKLETVQEIRDRTPFSEFQMRVDVTRRWGYYIWKIAIPLVLLVVISWSVFWMIGDGLADRMSISLTGLLTVVAYQFIISEDLPPVPYFTLMDSVLTFSFIIMITTIIESVFVNTLYLQHRQQLSIRIDHACRVAFPLVYFAGLLLLAIYYMG